MRRGWVCMAVCTVLLCLILVACGGGNGEPAVLPAKGTEVCGEVKGAERFRYTFSYILESAQQENPPEDSAGGDYATKPSQPDFRAPPVGGSALPAAWPCGLTGWIT